MNQDISSKTPDEHLPADIAPSDSEERTLALLQKIRAGRLNTASLSASERRQLVSYLAADGYSTADLAQILQVTERSIERYKKALREANAIVAGPELVEQMVGRLVSEAELAIQRIRRVIRDSTTPNKLKVHGEYQCFQIMNEMIRSMQHLGYLPTAAARLQADITHNIGQIPELPELDAEAQRLIRITREMHGTDPMIKQQLTEIETQIVKVRLADKIQTINNVIKEQGDHDHESEQL